MNRDEILNETYQFNCNLSNKLKVLNFSRPNKSQITSITKSYIQVFKNEFRNLKLQVMHMYKLKKKTA